MGRVSGRIARAMERTPESSPRRKSGRVGVVCAIAISLLAGGLVTGSQFAVALPPQPDAPRGQGFELNAGDLRFILKQIKIAEAHAAVNYDLADDSETLAGNSLTGIGKYQIGNPLLPYGLRTVDGSFNNLVPGQEGFGATGHTLVRLTTAVARQADAPWDPDGPGGSPALGGPANDGTTPAFTDYGQKLAGNVVIDRQPREISNLIVDQTPSNPAAVAAAKQPNRSAFTDPTAWPCGDLPYPAGFDATNCTPAGETLDIPNVTTDFGLSPAYNSWFTIFGQFFDHGLDLTAKAGGTVYVPLKADDPLIAGPNMIFEDDPSTPGVVEGDDLALHLRFMPLTRAQNGLGVDGIRGTLDDEIDTTNGDSSWVDQSQTYTSIPSHQVFLREYAPSVSGPIATGRLIEGAADNSMSTWADVKLQARTLLGIDLVDADSGNVPMIVTDPYGRFLRGNDGFPQLVQSDGSLVEGNLAFPISTANAMRTNIAFLNDIAHNAAPGTFDLNHDTVPDGNKTRAVPYVGDPTTYDGALLDAHFMAGDGRVNENIALTAVHQIFHSEHNRLVDRIASQIASEIPAQDKAAWADTSTHWLTHYEYPVGGGANLVHDAGWRASRDGIYQERLFQAARFVTEMEYQHLVFEEFGRKIQPLINPFNVFTQSDTGIDPAITAEFAHAVYRFGHSMLTDTVARTSANGTPYDQPLLDVFLNPGAYLDGPGAGTSDLTPKQAAGEIIMGLTDQAGQELDEFVVDTLRNNLLGLPLDLPTINMARARDAGIPPLNVLRAEIYAGTGDAALQPYVSWNDFKQSLKHPESLVNFVAAYGTHGSVTSAATLAAKRAAAQTLVTNNDPFLDTPAATSGLDNVDLWIGGLAEITNIGGGLLGSTFNYVFERQLTDLQDGDRLYYLSRTSGMNLRTQLEGNSFAELIQRNTTAVGLKADVFATADCEFDLDGLVTIGNTVVDDPDTGCNENALLTVINGAVAYRVVNTEDPAGLNAQATYNGTPGTDRMRGGVDTDTFWGGDGADIIEGNDGGDLVQSGDGDDIVTDTHGVDLIRSGNGNDAVDAGPDGDVIMTGYGDDFSNGGLNGNQTFAGEGDDLVIAGGGPDTVFGSGGDDWLDGGNANDLLQGDSGAPFFDDINCTYDDSLPVPRCVGGNDVFIGGSGEDDYDAEGGDDIQVAGPGIERNAGLTGFDWVTHKGSAENGYSDLTIHVNAAPGALADRFLMTESASGWDRDDELLGDQWTTLEQDVELHGPWGSNALTTAGINRIAGLRTLLAQHDRIGEDLMHATGTPADDCYTDPQVFGDEGEGGPPSPVAVTICGYVKGAIPAPAGTPPAGGNIIIGGGGSDKIRGRGADDVIDGNKWLNVRLTAINDSGTTISVDNLVQLQQYFMSDPASPTHINPGNVNIVREILNTTGAVDCVLPGLSNCDTAMYGGAYADYDFWTDANGVLRVSHVRNVPPPTDQALPGGDGTDTLTNIEMLQFTDTTVSVASLPVATASPATQAFGNRLVGSGTTQTVTVTNSGGGLPLAFFGSAITGTGAAAYTTTNNCTTVAVGNNCTFNVTFAPTAIGAFPAELTISTNAGAKIVSLTGDGVTAPSAPGTPTAVAGNGSATVTWTAPASSGGSPITGYSVQVTNNAGAQIGALRTAAGSPFLVTGLTNGTIYRFRVQASNAVATGPFSGLSNAVTPSAGGPVDTIRPSVIAGSRVPANNANGAAVNKAANITATFSEGVVGVGGATAKLYRLSGFLNSTATEWPSTVSSTATTVTIDPTGNLNNGTFVVVLSAGTAGSPLIRDLANNRLETNVASNLAFLLTPNIYSWQFTTSNASPAALAGFSALTSARLLDTRGGNPATEAASGPVTPGHPLTVNVAGHVGVPAAGAAAVSLNVTVTNPAAAGWVKVYGCGDMPATSNVNFAAGQTVANAVLTPVAANGTFCIASHVPTDVVVDINGYFTAGAGMAPVTPARVLDTRDIGARLSAGVPLKLAIAGHGGVVEGASAVSLNVTVVDPSRAGWVKVHPCGSEPATSNVNFTANQTVANATIATLAMDGSICITSLVDADVVVDVNGYFTSDTGQAPFTPRRLVDTRPGESPDAAVGVDKVQVTPGSPLRITVAGLAGVPTEGVGAVALNVTATNPAAGGWLNVYGCGTAPFASNVNFVGGQTVANAVLSPVSADGAICISSNIGTDVVVDINGYFEK